MGGSPYRVPYYYDFKDKDKCVKNYVNQMLNRTYNMFKYTNLPDTIPELFLEMQLQRNGCCGIIRHNNELYAVYGGLGGILNEYYFPRNFIVANPYLNISYTYTINEDCILFRNDSEIQGIIPICSKYASLLVENDITMRQVIINRRIPIIVKTHSDKEKDSANLFMSRIEHGENVISITEQLSNTIDCIDMDKSYSTRLTEYIEAQQYIKAQWYNELGIRMSHNMKREALSESEIAANDDAVRSLPIDMLKCRKKAVEEINNMFGTNISVEYNEIWAEQVEISKLSIDKQKAEIESVEESTRIDKGVRENEEEVITNDGNNDKSDETEDISDSDKDVSK